MTNTSYPPSSSSEINVNVLADYLFAHLDLTHTQRDSMALEKFSGGQSNPTYLLNAKDKRFVLRRQPFGKLLKSAHAVDREFRVLSALAETNVPVPKTYHLCEDPSVIGSMFYIMEFIPGRILWDSALPDVKRPETRRSMYQEMVNVMAALHDVDFKQVGLEDYGRPGNYFERQVSRWTKQYRQSELTRINDMETLISWLEVNLPADDGALSIVHGDYRLDNVIFAPDSPQILAVVDWELSTLGHPLADLAYQCMQLRLPANVGHAPGLGGVNRAALGIPSESEYLGWYCENRGISHIDNWHFYLAFSFFRLAAIAQGVAKRAEAGNASNTKAKEVGALVAPLAAMAVNLINQA
ncbi:phosphotransferase family protein [Aestuariibacter sp. AA17]|uniref:Phosphotransferase family protein n=1 Tax=Fluctibacter corallii TaxID=2984329 RepID=A0ABT3A5F5_9ALTE|nr:phosphotransferase family protein [Aestuariibacter sp. AA17]MCV2883779.1 phosphotransferase family protein [Aestuariibacter sp. AA17]